MDKKSEEQQIQQNPVTPNVDEEKKADDPSKKEETKKDGELVEKKINPVLEKYKKVVEDKVKEVWKEEKYKEVGNLQKIVRESTKRIKEEIEAKEKEAGIEPNPNAKPLNLEQFRDYVLEILAGKIMKKYKEDFKSLVIGQKYNVKTDPSIVFVFKSDPQLYREYKKFEGQKEKKEKKAEPKEEAKNAENNAIELGQIKPEFKEDDPKSKDEMVKDISKDAVNEEGKKIVDEQKDNLMNDVAERKEQAMDEIDMDEEKKKKDVELNKGNQPNNDDSNNHLEKEAISNTQNQLKDTGAKAFEAGKTTIGNNKSEIDNKVNKDWEVKKNSSPEGDTKLDIGETKSKGTGKDQSKDNATKMADLEGKDKETKDPSKANKESGTPGKVVEFFKKIAGSINEPRALSEREKILSNIDFIFKVFAEMDNEGQILLKMVIKEFVEKRSKEYQKNNPDKFNKEKAQIEKRKLNKKKKKETYEEKLLNKYVLFEFDVKDVILILARMFKFLCGVTTTVELEEEEMFVKLFVKVKNLVKLAECFEYELQLKPYALIYSEYKKEKKIMQEERAKEIANVLCSDKTQFHEIDLDNQKIISPYLPLYDEKTDKFRKYLENDDFHTCIEDEEYDFNAEWDFDSDSEEEEEDDYEIDDEEKKVEEEKENEPKCPQNCRIFRNIDRLRLIEQSIDEIANINLIKKHREFKDSFFLRNYVQYQDRMTNSYLVYSRWNIYDQPKQMELIQTIRNFFGEKVAFYIYWLTSFNRWLTFISFVGIAVFILMTLSSRLDSPLSKNGEIDIISLIYLIFCVFVATWATFFLKAWGQTEKLYTYLWGMDNVEGNAPYRKEFQYDKKEDFVFDKKIPYEAYWKKAVRLTISYIIMAIMCAISIAVVNGLFKINPDSGKPSSTSSGNSTNSTTPSNSSGATSNSNSGVFATPWPILIGIFNGIQIELTSFLFKKISIWLNDWENHEKNFQFEGSMVIKIVLYEFINNYNSLFYISFFKDLVDKCQGGNCMYELNVQVYSILCTKLATKFVELKTVTSLQDDNKKKFKEKYGKELETQSLHHQKAAEEYNNLIADYNEMLILFGYVVFFSSAAPLTPVIAFAITYMKKIIDSYKLFNCKKVNFITGSNGIEIYNYLFTSFYFLGLLTNVAVVLFSNPNLSKLDLYWKFVVFIIVENIFVVTIFIFNVNVLPHWFNNTNLIKTQYYRKFYMKDGCELPHHQFVEKKKPEWEEEADDSDDELYEDDDLFEEDDGDDEIYEAEEEEDEDELDEENPAGNIEPEEVQKMNKSSERLAPK